MKRSICLLIGLLLVAPAMGEEAEASKERSAEALEILEKVDTAIKAVHSVRYKAKATPSGFAVAFQPPAEGTSVMVGFTGSIPEKFYTHVKTQRPGSDESVELSGGGNGDTYFIVDHQSKKGYEDMDPAVMGSGARVLRGFGMIEFVHDRPFDDELGADVVQLLDEVTVEGEPCYQIRIGYGGGQGESIWLFSKKDYLPRRRVRNFSDPERGDGSLEITLSGLEVNIEPDASLFEMKLPEGYEQIDDFAP